MLIKFYDNYFIFLDKSIANTEYLGAYLDKKGEFVILFNYRSI